MCCPAPAETRCHRGCHRVNCGPAVRVRARPRSRLGVEPQTSALRGCRSGSLGALPAPEAPLTALRTPCGLGERDPSCPNSCQRSRHEDRLSRTGELRIPDASLAAVQACQRSSKVAGPSGLDPHPVHGRRHPRGIDTGWRRRPRHRCEPRYRDSSVGSSGFGTFPRCASAARCARPWAGEPGRLQAHADRRRLPADRAWRRSERCSAVWESGRGPGL